MATTTADGPPPPSSSSLHPPSPPQEVVVHDRPEEPRGAVGAEPISQQQQSTGLSGATTLFLALLLTLAYLAWDARRRRRRRHPQHQQGDRLHPARRLRLEAAAAESQIRVVRELGVMGCHLRLIASDECELI
jgi:hypothetical protein